MRTLFLCLISSLLLACGPDTPQSSTTSQEAFESYVAALNAGDINKAASYYDLSEGFHWIERGGIQYESGADAAEALRNFQTGDGRAEMTLDNLRVSKITDNATLLSSHFDFTQFGRAGKAQFSFDGWMTVGMVKRGNEWKIAGGQTGPGKTE